MSGRENLERVQRNVQNLRQQGAPESDVAAYLGEEGYTPARFERAVQQAQEAGDVRAQHGFIDSAAQGLTFGFADEIASRGRSMLGQGTYDEQMAARALEREHYQAQNPGRSMGAEILGTAPYLTVPPLGAAALGANAGRLGVNLARPATGYGAAALGGAAGGAAYGYGAADPGERGEGAVEGGAIGGVAGPAINALARPVGAIAGWAGSKLPGRRGPEAMQQRADEILMGRMRQDNVDPATLRQRLDEAVPPKPETVMELSGPNVRNLGDQAAMFPGQAPRMASELKEGRMGGAHERVAQDLEDAFGIRGSVRDAVATLDTQMREAASPLYDRAYAIGDVADPQLFELMRRPAMQDAYRRARQIAGNEGVELPPRLLDNEGNLLVDALPFRTLDLMKRALDDVLYSSKMPTSGMGRTEMGSIEQLRQQFVQRLDEINPAYGQARAAWAGPAAMLEAVDEGRKALRMRPEELQELLGALPQAEAGMYRFGALDELRQQILNAPDGRNAYALVFGSDGKRERLRHLVGEDAFRDLQRQMRRELEIRRSDDLIRGGSQTQPRAVGMEEIQSPGMLEMLGLKALLGRAMARVRTGLGSSTADALAPSLYTTDRGQIAELANRLERLHDVQGGQQLLQGLSRGAAGGVQSGVLLDTPGLLE